MGETHPYAVCTQPSRSIWVSQWSPHNLWKLQQSIFASWNGLDTLSDAHQQRQSAEDKQAKQKNKI